MAISTYTELKTAIASWLHEDSLTAVIPDFITIGEATLNRRLRLLNMEATASVDTNTSDRYAALPSDFSEIIDLTLYSNNYPQTIQQETLSTINGYSTTNTAIPTSYAISSNIIYNCISDQVYPATLRYFKRLDLETDTTNFLLTSNPDIYLYSALLASAPYIVDDARMGTWANLLENAISTLNKQDARNRSKVNLKLEPMLMNNRSYTREYFL